MKQEIQDIITKMIPLFNRLSEVCKEGNFTLPNGEFSVRFDNKASDDSDGL